ncbi:MAG: hypothetical protein RLZZ515_58 [Cyanobacteriota bacterium]|jgi:hypothetical protein
MLRQDQTALLLGVPAHWRFALTGGDGDAKRCFEENWNQPGHGHSLDSVVRINATPNANERWKHRKTIGLGVITGEESNGLLVLDFDGTGSQSVRAFRRHFNRFPSELPVTVANMSGKLGRGKCFFSVPPQWWPQFANRSASWRSSIGNVVLEAIWQNTTGAGRHAVIIGDHPESSHQAPLYYRWMEGRAPSDVPVAEAPEWLLEGILRQADAAKERTVQERLRSGEDDGTPWERLTAFERRELVELALPYCPNRQGKGSGTYEKVRRVMCAVLNEFGLELAIEMLEGSDWNAKNEWGDRTDCAKTLKSLAQSRVVDEQKSRIASVFFFAREAGWEPPSWAIPPVDLQVGAEGYRKIINEFIKHENDSIVTSYLLGRAKKEYGIDAERIREEVLQQFLGQVERQGPRKIEEIQQTMRKDNICTDVIDGFLGRRVHLLAGASHSGKTTLACFLANRVLHGLPIEIDGTRHSVEKPGKVLIFTSDCSDLDMVRDLALEGIESSDGRLDICSAVTFDRMVSIVKTLQDYTPDLVIYDCLTSMMGTDAKISDGSYGRPIRQLVQYNGVAWPACAHLILHHTTRDEPTRFSGSEQVKAATEEMWVYYPPEMATWRRGQPMPEIGPTRHLVMQKSRTGYRDKRISVTRNPYQGYWQLRLGNPEAGGPLDMLSHRFRAVRHEEWRIASEWAKELDLGFNSRTLRRYLDQMTGTVLESRKLRSRVTGRYDTHYRPRQVIRDAANAMAGSKAEGINNV